MAIAAFAALGPMRLTREWASRWLAVAVAAGALLVYLATLAPGLTFLHYGADGGDLIAAAATLGVPHPPGYPTYTLLAWLATRLPIGSVAFRVNLLSAVCAAAAVGFAFLNAQALLPAHKHRQILSAAAALTLAFSSLFWSQAVIAEVYALLVLFASLLLFLLVRWARGGGDRYLWLASFTLGLGLGNHLTLSFVVPSALILLWPQRRRWLSVRVLLPSAALFVAGLGVYAYLPLAAGHHPPVNWGDPRSGSRFLWTVTAQPYQSLAFGLPSEQVAQRLAEWASLFGRQFAWWGLAVALAGAWSWYRRDRRLALFGLTWGLLVAAYAFFYNTDDSRVYLLPAMLVLALCWAQGACFILDLLEKRGRAWHRIVSVMFGLMPLGLLALHWPQADLRHDISGDTYVRQVLESTAPNGLILVQNDAPTFALWYATYAQEQRPDVAVVNSALLAYAWYREQLRHTYPGLVVPDPAPGSLSPGSLGRDMIVRNYAKRPVYAIDPDPSWVEWFDLTQEKAALYRIHLKTKWELSR